MLTPMLVATWFGLCGAMLYNDPELWVVAASSLAFTAIRVLHIPLVAARVQGYQKLSGSDQLLWANTFTSMIHSTISAIMVLYTLYASNSLSGDYVTRTTYAEFLTISISTGYFAYDLWDYVLNRLYVKSLGIVVHHVVILICYICALVKTVGVPLLPIALICEMHSAFMHLRKLMSMSHYSLHSSIIYRLTWAAQWITFVLARVLPHMAVLKLVYEQRNGFGNQLFYGMAFGGMIFINILNIQLYRGVASAYRKDSRRSAAAIAKQQS